MVSQRQGGSLKRFRFSDGIFLGQWYSERFLAKSIVLKRFTHFFIPCSVDAEFPYITLGCKLKNQLPTFLDIRQSSDIKSISGHVADLFPPAEALNLI